MVGEVVRWRGGGRGEGGVMESWLKTGTHRQSVGSEIRGEVMEGEAWMPSCMQVGWVTRDG